MMKGHCWMRMHLLEEIKKNVPAAQNKEQWNLQGVTQRRGTVPLTRR
jgi:hypothetical protein